MFPIIGLERDKANVQEYEKILVSYVKMPMVTKVLMKITV
jgi:hypothetical protein